MFIIQLSDGIMSYVAPVFVEDVVHNPLIMGLVLSSSSVFGIVCDFVFPNVFRAKHHLFFLWNTVLIAMLFPAVFLFFPHALPSFILAMAVWGIYFEFMTFSNAYFIEAFITLNRHGLAWGILSTFRSLSYFIAPLIAPILLDSGQAHPLLTSMLLLGTGLGAIILFQRFFPNKKRLIVTEVVTKRYSARKELAIWRILMKKLWPLYIFVLSIFILEASMMSIGVLATEDLRQQSFIGGMFLAAHALPNLFTGLLVQKLGLRFGKKRLAFTCGSIGGVLLFTATLMPTPPLLVGMVFIAACFTSITYPAVQAAIQDYTTRLGLYGGEMIGINNSSGSLGYIIGPVLAGALGLSFGSVRAIGIIGLLFAFVSVLNFILVPRKLHMPQHQLQALNDLE